MKYIFFGPDFEPTVCMLKEAFQNNDCVRITMPYYNKIFVKLCHRIYYHFSFLRLLLKFTFKLPQIPKSENVAFIYFLPWSEIMAGSGFVRRLRKQYVNSIHIALFYDINNAKNSDVELIKRTYDRVYTYDKKEAKKLDVSYYPAVYSINFPIPNEDEELYDVSFIGQAKGRYSEIVRVFEKLSREGLKCHFYLVGVKEDEQKYKGQIVYGDTFLSEEESFLYTATSRCLLEIQLPDTTALTARVREAIVYGKKILTNNRLIVSHEFYNKQMIQIYSDVEEIKTDFFHSKKGSYHYNGEFSPLLFLKEIEQQFMLIKQNERGNKR